MKLKMKILWVVLTVLTTTAYAQIDSLENRILYNWKLNPYDLSLELVEVDTSLTAFQNFNPLLKTRISNNYLGNLGTAAQSKVYFDRELYETGFLFSEPYGVYFHLPYDQLYYNTKKQFTLLNYSTGGPKEESEQVLGVLHTQNINENFNFGFDYDLISSAGRYQNQEIKQNLISLFSSYSKKAYTLHTNFGFNRLKGQENAGIDSLQFLNDNDYSNRKNIPVRLSDARTQVLNTNFYLAQEYSFGRTKQEVKEREEVAQQKSIVNKLSDRKSLKGKPGKPEEDFEKPQDLDAELNDTSSINNNVSDTTESKIIVDTIQVFRSSGFSISHELTYNSDVRKFFDESVDEDFYIKRDIFIDSLKTHDEVRQKILGNKLALNYKYSDKFSARFAFYNESAKYRYNIKHDTIAYLPVIDTIIRKDTSAKFYNNNLSVYLKAFLFNQIYFSGYAEQYISGYKKDNSKLNMKFAYILKNNIEFSLEGKYENSKPDFFYNHYASNNFKWNNDSLENIEEWNAGFSIQSSKYKFYLKAKYGQITNLVYLDTLAYVNQNKNSINVLSIDLYKHLKVGIANSITRFVYQTSSNDSLISIPEYNLYQSFYLEHLWKFPATGGELLWQLGIDYRYSSGYYADGYMPPSGLFHRQFDYKADNYQSLDLFVNVNIKRVRIYLKYSYLNTAVNDEYYLTGPHYPAPDPIFKWGLAWTFYD